MSSLVDGTQWARTAQRESNFWLTVATQHRPREGVYCGESSDNNFPRLYGLGLSENRRQHSHAQAESVVHNGDLFGVLYLSRTRLFRPIFLKTAGLNAVTKHPGHGHR